MDIKKRIQELSLDQKAKLYFMGLVRQGKIDTLPEDPKAAYMNMLYKDLANIGKDKMDKDDYGRSVSGKDKSTFMEPEDMTMAARAKKLSGMEDDPRMDPAIRSDFDDPMFENDKSKEDKLKMAYAAYDKAEMNGDIRGQELALAVIDLMKNNKLKEMATELGYLEEMKVTDKDGNDVTSDIIKKIEKSLKDAGYTITKGYSSDANIRPGYKTRNENINENKVNISYTDPGFRFYKMKVDGKRLDREEGTKYLKDLGIVDDEGKDMEIPKSYDESILDKIVAQLKEKGIDADHDAAMDVS